MSDFYFPLLDTFGLDAREQSLAEFLMRLQAIKPKVELEFGDTFATWAKVHSLREALKGELAAMQAEAVNGVAVYTPGFAGAEIREQSALLRAESSAGSLILMLDDIMQRLRQSVWDDAANAPKSQNFALGNLRKSGGSATKLIYAAGNAYRHSRDWNGLIRDDGTVDEGHEQYDRAKCSLSILEPIIGLSAIISDMTCIAAVTALSLGDSGRISFESLWDDTISGVARDFAKEYCRRANAIDYVTEALEYQEAVTNIEVSYTMDERLFPDYD